MPGFSSVTFNVAPFIGLPLSACRTSGRAIQPSADGLPDQDGRQFGAFALMRFPAHDFPAEDVHHQTELKEHARYRPRQPDDVPGPDLAGPAGLVVAGGLRRTEGLPCHGDAAAHLCCEACG